MDGITEKHIRKIVTKMGKTDDEYNLSVAEDKMVSIKKQLRGIGKMQVVKWFQKNAINWVCVLMRETRK